MAKKKTGTKKTKKLKKLPSKGSAKKSPKAAKKGSAKTARDKAKRVLGKVDAKAAKDFVDRYDYSELPDIPWYNLDEGQHKLRVLPPWKSGLTVPGQAVYRHWSVPNPDDHSKMTSVVCPEKTFPESNLRCPVCEAISDIEDKTGIEIKRERAGLRVYANIIARSKTDDRGRKMTFEDEATKVWVCGMPTSVFNKIMKLCYDQDIGDVTDLEDGYDLTIERTGAGLNTEYDVRLIPRPKPLFPKDSDVQKAIEDMYDLDEIFAEPDDEYKKRLKGVAALLSRKFMAPEDEEEEVEEEEDDEEEGEEPENEEDDEEDDGEEDEEPEEEEEEVKGDEEGEDEEAEEEDDDEGVEEEEGEEEDEGDESEEVETAEEAIRALKLKPLKADSTKNAIKVGGPACYGQYPKVAKKFREVCANCAYEYPCAEDSGLEAPY